MKAASSNERGRLCDVPYPWCSYQYQYVKCGPQHEHLHVHSSYNNFLFHGKTSKFSAMDTALKKLTVSMHFHQCFL